MGKEIILLRAKLCLNSQKLGVSTVSYLQRQYLHTIEKAPTKEVKIPIQFGHIAAKQWGDDQERPILALHGWQDNAGTWDTLAPLLCKNRSILAVDFPGHGLSSWLPSGVHYYNWELPRLILYLKNYFKWDKLSLLCHSFGSVAGSRFASIFPDDVDCHITMDSFITDDFDIEFIVNRYSNIIRKMDSLMPRLYEEPPAYTLEELTKIYHVATDKSVPLENVKYILERGIKQSKKYPNKYYISRDPRIKYSLFQPENKKLVKGLLSRLKCPTLYFKATDSPNASSAYSIEMREMVERNNKNYEFHFVPGTHHVHLNNPESDIPDAIEKLETKNLALCKSLEILEKMIEQSNALPNSQSQKVRGKLDAVLCKTPGLEGIKKINAFINGTGQSLPEEVSAEMASNFKFCQLMSKGHFRPIN